MYSRKDIAAIRRALAIKRLSYPEQWRTLALRWQDHERARIGEPTTPHEYALRFIYEWTRASAGEAALATDDAEAFYLALREAFYQAMTQEVQTHAGPGHRAVK